MLLTVSQVVEDGQEDDIDGPHENGDADDAVDARW